MVHDIGQSVHDITDQGTHCQAGSQGAAPPVIKRGGFVDLLIKFMPRTYNVGDAATATDSYEVSKFEKVPTIFDWDPNIDY